MSNGKYRKKYQKNNSIRGFTPWEETAAKRIYLLAVLLFSEIQFFLFNKYITCKTGVQKGSSGAD